MSEEYPLFPELSEHGKQEAQKLLDGYKTQILAAVKSLMEDLYTDVVPYIESDSWCNYRNKMMDGFKGYGNESGSHDHAYKELRQAIYKANKDEILKDLNQDLVEENALLQTHIDLLVRQSRDRY